MQKVRKTIHKQKEKKNQQATETNPDRIQKKKFIYRDIKTFL